MSLTIFSRQGWVLVWASAKLWWTFLNKETVQVQSIFSGWSIKHHSLNCLFFFNLSFNAFQHSKITSGLRPRCSHILVASYTLSLLQVYFEPATPGWREPPHMLYINVHTCIYLRRIMMFGELKTWPCIVLLFTFEIVKLIVSRYPVQLLGVLIWVLLSPSRKEMPPSLIWIHFVNRNER